MEHQQPAQHQQQGEDDTQHGSSRIAIREKAWAGQHQQEPEEQHPQGGDGGHFAVYDDAGGEDGHGFQHGQGDPQIFGGKRRNQVGAQQKAEEQKDQRMGAHGVCIGVFPTGMGDMRIKSAGNAVNKIQSLFPGLSPIEAVCGVQQNRGERHSNQNTLAEGACDPEQNTGQTHPDPERCADAAAEAVRHKAEHGQDPELQQHQVGQSVENTGHLADTSPSVIRKTQRAPEGSKGQGLSMGLARMVQSASMHSFSFPTS